jgi:hypothetical protein
MVLNITAQTPARRALVMPVSLANSRTKEDLMRAVATNVSCPRKISSTLDDLEPFGSG